MVRVLDLDVANARDVLDAPIDLAVAVGVVLLVDEHASLVLEEPVARAVSVAIDLDARGRLLAIVGQPAVGLSVLVGVLFARCELTVGQVEVLRVERAVVVGVLGARDRLPRLRVDQDLDLGPAVPIRVERLHHFFLLPDLLRLGLEDRVGDVALAGALGRGRRIARVHGAGAVARLLLERLVRLFLLVDGGEQVFLTLQLGLDLGFELFLLLDLFLDLVAHLLVGAARARVRRRGTAAGLERNVAGDHAVDPERRGADQRADAGAELCADHGADDHALEPGLRAPRERILALALRLSLRCRNLGWIGIRIRFGVRARGVTTRCRAGCGLGARRRLARLARERRRRLVRRVGVAREHRLRCGRRRRMRARAGERETEHTHQKQACAVSTAAAHHLGHLHDCTRLERRGPTLLDSSSHRARRLPHARPSPSFNRRRELRA